MNLERQAPQSTEQMLSTVSPGALEGFFVLAGDHNPANPGEHAFFVTKAQTNIKKIDGETGIPIVPLDGKLVMLRGPDNPVVCYKAELVRGKESISLQKKVRMDAVPAGAIVMLPHELAAEKEKAPLYITTTNNGGPARVMIYSLDGEKSRGADPELQVFVVDVKLVIKN